MTNPRPIVHLLLFAGILSISLWGCGSGGSGSSPSSPSDAGNTGNPSGNERPLFSSSAIISQTDESDRPVLAFGSSGESYFLWEGLTSGKKGIFFSSAVESGGTPIFQAGSKVDPQSISGLDTDPRIAVSPEGLIFVTYTGPDPKVRGGESHIFLNYANDRLSPFAATDLPVSPIDNLDGVSSSVVVTPQNDLFVAWAEGPPTQRDIFYASTPSKQPKEIDSPRNISNSSEDSEGPLLGFDGSGHVYAAWEEGPPTARDIYFKPHAEDPLFAPTNISKSPGTSRHPIVSCSGFQNVVVVWEEGNSPGREVYYSRSINGGYTFSTPRNLSASQEDSSEPRVVCGGNDSIYAAWTETVSGNKEIYFRTSQDGGNSFLPAKNLSNNNGASTSPRIAANPFGDVLVVWADTTPENSDIFAAGSQDGGISFHNVVNLSESSGNSISPAAGWNGFDRFVVAWADDTWGKTSQIVVRTGGWISSSRISIPKILSPKNGSGTPKRPLVAWSAVPNAVQYHLQVDDQPDFSSPEVDGENPATFFRLPDNLSRRTYYARVMAMDASGEWTHYSSLIQFDLGSPPGDVDGDGHSDILVGAPAVDATTGKVLLYWGNASGVEGTPVVFQGESNYEHFGSSVAMAGDVNGDGDEDILIGAPWSGNRRSGKTYLYLGRETRTPLLFSTLSAEDIGAELGTRVAGAGDVNHDGCGDFLVGAPGAPGGGAHRGEAYLFLGGGAGCAVAALDLAPDLVFNGPSEASDFGSALGSAGDVNGDGYDDFVIAAPAHLETGGVVYLYLGGPIPNSIPDVTFTGNESTDFFGFSLSGAGDLNRDGFGDILIGAPGIPAGELSGAGRVSLFYGAPLMDSTADILIQGENAQDQLGHTAAGIGDINFDGYDDILVSAPFWDIPGSDGGFPTPDAGRAYLFSGGSLSRKTGSLAAGESDAIYQGTGKELYLGWDLSGAGDVNGDGPNDFLIGVPFGKDGAGDSVGEGDLFWGSDTAPAPLSPAAILYGDTPFGLFGSTLEKQKASP